MPLITPVAGDGATYALVYTNSTANDQAINVTINNHSKNTGGFFSLYVIPPGVSYSPGAVAPSQIYATDPVNSPLDRSGQIIKTNQIVPPGGIMVFYGSHSNISFYADYLQM